MRCGVVNRLRIRALICLEALLDSLITSMPPVAHAAAAECVDRSVVHDAQHPRSHASSPSVVTRSAAPYGQTRFLGDVVGGRVAATDAIGKREGRVGMTFEDHLEGIRIAGCHELHQLL